MQEAIEAIPEGEREAEDFLIVRPAPRGHRRGYIVTGRGQLCEMVRAAIDNIADCAVDERKH